MDHTEELTHISLCAGYGGIDLGLQRVIPSLRTIAFSEIEAYAVANLVSKIEAGYLDAAPIWSDLKTFPFSSFHGKVFILSSGFPCQPFSKHGRKAGDQDPRHLWPYIVRGIRESAPRMVFFENVEGIITSKLKIDGWNDPKGTPVLLHVLRELERLGYRATAGVFSASEVGAPHQRRRVFILGSKIEQVKIIPFECSKYPAKRGQKQYDWEPPRVLTMDDAKGQRIQECESQETFKNKKRRPLENGQLRGANRRCDELHWKTQSPMGGYVDGSTNRVDDGELYESFDNVTDELRLLGNGVVPDTAARAFEVLWNRLNETRIH